MALVVNRNSEALGYTFPEAYAKILFCRTFNESSFVLVAFYSDQNARQAEKQPVEQVEYKVGTASLVGDFWPAMYSYLKSLPEFAGAIDV